ncbi:MAG: chemotaxis protein CheW [Planctomycetes bacterium]|nr:chemotaxis protein CheW [Planctomycetota bacterium]
MSESAVAIPDSIGSENVNDVADDGLQLVGFRLADEEYGIDIMCVQEIILPGAMTELPQVPDFIRGLINLRGSIIPVIDLRMRFGLRVSQRTDASRVIVTEVQGRTVGIVVDAVSEVLRVSSDQIDPPATIGNVEQAYIKGLVKLEHKLLILLEIEALLEEEIPGDLPS